MHAGTVRTAVFALALCAPRALAAQTGTLETSVTFLVPVNLTQLSPDLEKVRALCCVLPSTVMIPNLPPGFPLPVLMTEAPVVSGQVNTTLRSEYLVFSGSLQNAVGKQADYSCTLQGYSKSLQRWDEFSDTAQDAVFRLRPTPPTLQGSFVW